MLVLTVVFRPNPLPNDTLPTLEAGLGTLVPQASIEHTTVDQLHSLAYAYAQTPYRIESFPKTSQCLRRSRRSSTTGSASEWRSYKESRALLSGDLPAFRRFSAV